MREWYFHAQNLNDRSDRTQGSMWRHGRCWWGPLNAEWHIGHKPKCGLSFAREDEGRLLIGLRLIFVSLYLSAAVVHPSRDDREFNIYVADGSVWLALWGYPMGKLHGREAWWEAMHVFHVKDWILGRQKYSAEIVEEREALVPMPEGSYPAKVKLERATWKRPRWFAFSRMCADVEMVKPIPFEGKGENSWDCGEDALHGLHTAANTVDEAVSKVVASVMKDRRRYGTPSRLQPVIAA